MISTSPLPDPGKADQYIILENDTGAQQCYAAWLEWASIARHRYRGASVSNLLDTFVDPAVEKHMTLLHYRYRPALPQSVKEFVIHVTHNVKNNKPTFPTLPQTVTGADESTNALAAENHNVPGEKHPPFESSCKDDHVERRSSFTSYPNVSDVDIALEKCDMSGVLQTWLIKNPNTRQDGLTEVPEKTVTRVEVGSDSMVGSFEQALDEFHISTNDDTTLRKQVEVDSQSKPETVEPSEQFVCAPETQASRPPADSSFSSSAYKALPHSNNQDTLPTPLLRVTTSAVIGQQSEIWNHIQLERQEHHIGSPSSGPIRSPTPLVGHQTAYKSNNSHRNNTSMTEPPVASEPNSTHSPSTKNQIQQRYTISSESSSPNVKGCIAGTQSLSMAEDFGPASTLLFEGRVPVTTSENSTSGPGTQKRHASNSSKRVPFPLFSQSKPAPVQQGDEASVPQRNGLVDHRHEEPMKHVAAMSDIESATVPCLECSAPLHLSSAERMTANSNATVLYCRSCGTVASSELMRTIFYGDAGCSSS